MMRLNANLPSLIERYGSRVTLGGGRYVLASLPALQIPPRKRRTCGGLWFLAGISVSLWPARNVIIQSPVVIPNVSIHWVANGMLLQINAASITGAYGRQVQRLAMKVLTEFETSSVVASNARDTANRRSLLPEARSLVAKKLSGSRAHTFFSHWPAAIIDVDQPNGNGNLKVARAPWLLSCVSCGLPIQSQIGTLRVGNG